MRIEQTEIDQNWNDAETVIWFNVNDESYGIGITGNDYYLLDADSARIADCNDHSRLFRLLQPLAQQVLEKPAGS